MEPPVTPKPMPASTTKPPLDHTNKLFGIIYITLTGVIDTIVPAAGPWLWVGKSMSYLIKLALILWWALPTQSTICQFPNASKPADQGWFPDRESNLVHLPSQAIYNKYNYLPEYLVTMILTLTLQFNFPQEIVTTSDTTFTQMFGVLYIALTGLMDSIVPNSGP
ncbi:hypothetical protein DSO57_1033206 [Entomophthora muscae]|uniref:Uncharacterized protein n=1 Tax=Entomophthora muscae TaxID=34485 RepID=A0ACC2TLW5_9FUNG|nr:hypothetical protein DSO57_1033206 [Entomophthora muscae]